MTAPSTTQTPGRFGDFGGRYVSETLIPSLDQLAAAWATASVDPVFHAEFDRLLKQINSETDKGKRKKLFAQGMGLLDQTAPLYLIGFTDHLPMWRTNVKGHASEIRVFSELGRVDTFWLDR